MTPERRPRLNKTAVASFLVPVLSVMALLYQGFAVVDISVGETASLLVIAGAVAVAAVIGLAAAFGGERTRVIGLALATVLLLDMTVHPSRLFDAMYPAARLAAERDERRVADLHGLKDALDRYVAETGQLPRPSLYGEGSGPESFWAQWWDVSAVDVNGDGHPFMDFLANRGGHVPVDPLNAGRDASDPRAGHQYVYYVAPAGYDYQGGPCEAWAGKSVYLLGITRFEGEPRRASAKTSTACQCLWRDAPNFFQQYFDYLLCGTSPR